MLKEQSLLLQRLLFVADVCLLALAWLLAYYVRFWLLFPGTTSPLSDWAAGLPYLVVSDTPPLLWDYLAFLPAVLVAWSTMLLVSGLYQTRRAQRLPLVIYGVAKAVALALFASLAALFFYRAFSFSRVHMLAFGLISSGLLVALRLGIYTALRIARLQGKNARRVLIVGAGRVGQRLARAFEQYPWMGFQVLGFLDDRLDAVHLDERGQPEIPPRRVRLLGPVDELPALLDRYHASGQPVDMVYVALPLAAAAKIEMVANACSQHIATMSLVPDLLHLNLLVHHRVSDIDGLPVIHFIDETPFEVRRVLKRVLDVAFSLVVLLILSPVFALIALGVKLSSPGPVFYRQERMSLNGQTFGMLKFRSMPVDVESATGAVWAKPGEQRATPFGAFLRRTSLDELPQFLNVLLGDMSVVGPRPERPVFIEEFRQHVPGYMLRHKVKAGITGWAQVNGWRGDTSIEKRIEHDLYYIQHWSLGLDLKIVGLTLVKGFVDKNAY